MVWSEGPKHISNFDRYDQYDIGGCDYGYIYFDGSGRSQASYDDIVELLATIANQNDGIAGFQVDTDNRGYAKGGWMHYSTATNGYACPNRDNGVRPGDSKGNQYERFLRSQPNRGQNIYLKKSASGDAFKIDKMYANNEGVISNNQTGVSLCRGSSNCYYKEKRNGLFNGSNNYSNAANTAQDMKAPLGWRYIIADNNMFGDGRNNYHTAWNLQQNQTPNTLNHIADGSWDDSLVVWNVGFDVQQNFDTMVSQGIDPADALIIKHEWCKKSVDNLNNPLCSNFYSTPEANQQGFKYDQDMFYLCKNDPNWFQKSSCRTAINNGVKGSNESVRQQSKDLVKGYCNTQDGETNSDGLCGCANVVKYAGRCLTDKADVPGCKELKTTVGDLPPSAQVAFSDMFCASDVCVTQALGDAALLPSYTQGKQCPNITQCVQDFRGGHFENSQLELSCKNTVNITGLAPPAPDAGPAPTPAAAPSASTPAAPAASPAANGSTPAAPQTPGGGTPAANPNLVVQPGKSAFVDNYINTPQKQYAALGCCIVLILLCLMSLLGSKPQQGIDPMMLAMMMR